MYIKIIIIIKRKIIILMGKLIKIIIIISYFVYKLNCKIYHKILESNKKLIKVKGNIMNNYLINIKN